MDTVCRRRVLLLNSSLTVRAGQPGSHQGKGWETFTNAAVKALNDAKEGLVFLLWGRPAQERLLMRRDAAVQAALASFPRLAALLQPPR